MLELSEPARRTRRVGVSRPVPILLGLLAPLFLAAPGPAHAQSEILVCDSTLDSVVRLFDADGDGVFAPTEVSIFYDDSSAGPDLSTPNHIVPWNSGFLVSDGGTLDAILFLRDLNGDGDALDAGEVTSFYDDTSPGPDLSVPNGMAIGSDGALYVCDDGATVQAVFRFVDLDGDGNALSAGEVTVFFDITSPLTDPVTDPEAIAAAPDGSIIVGDTATGRIVRLRDLDGDGTALGAGEATVIYDAGGSVPLTDLDSLQVDAAGRIYAIDEDNGTVIRLEDLNGDGDALDPAELLLFYDGTAPGALVSDPNDAILVGPGRLLVGDGLLDAVVMLEDLDGDGTALAANETRIVFEDGGVTFSTPHGLALPAAPPPTGSVTIDSVSPTIGDAAGGASVTITGGGWSTTAAVTADFGGVPIAATVISSTQLSVVAPSHAPALVDVGVTTAGESAVLAGAFRFQHRFRRGDATLDGVFGIADPIVVIYYLFVPGSAVPACFDAADTDDDDTIELDDAILALDYLFGGGPPPASPFPGAGFDPTPLGPGCVTPGP